jgi:hypothetical protein
MAGKRHREPQPAADPKLVTRDGGFVDSEHIWRRDVPIRCGFSKRDSDAESAADPMAPASYDAERHEIDFAFGAGAPVVRRPWGDDPYVEELSMDPAHVRLGRLNNGAPLLDSHMSGSLERLLGAAIPGTARVEDGEGMARVRLTRAVDAEGKVQRITEGTARNGSIGYQIHRVEETPANADTGEMRRVLAVDWEIYELSAVPMGADDSAGTRAAGSEPAQLPPEEGSGGQGSEQTMPNDETRKQQQAEAQAAIEAARAEAKAEAERQTAANVVELMAIGKRHSLPDEMVTDAIKNGTSLDQFRLAALEKLAEQSDASRVDPAVAAGEQTEHEKRLETMSAWMETRLQPTAPLDEKGNRWVGYSFSEMVRADLEARGISASGMSKTRLVEEGLKKRAYHATADFPLMLAEVMGKVLRDAYTLKPKTYEPFVRKTTVPDFKLQRRIQLGEMPPLQIVDENAAFQRGTMTEGQETYRIQTAGRIVGLSRQALINDDLGGFGRIADGFMWQVANYENDLVWGLITANGLMADGIALFAAAAFPAGHQNNIAAGGGGALYTTAYITALSLLMRTQVGLDATSVMRITPKFLLCPEAQRDGWMALLGGQFAPTTAANVVTREHQRLSDGIISDPLLDANSVVRFYLVADPAQIDFIEVAELAGEQGIFTETQMGWSVDGIETKIRRDFGAGVIDHRGAVRHEGP